MESKKLSGPKKGVFGEIVPAPEKDRVYKKICLNKMKAEFGMDLPKIQREVKALEMLEHLNVVTYFGHKFEGQNASIYEADWNSQIIQPPYDSSGGTPPETDWIFLSMEKCDQDLEQFLSSGGTNIDSKTIYKLMVEISSGLTYIHSKNLIHRDFKPSNILLKNGVALVAKIGDFGLSIEDARSKSKSVRGTELYRAPEVNTRWYGTKSDVYSFGLVLLESLLHHTEGIHKVFDAIWDKNYRDEKLQKAIVKLKSSKEAKLIAWMTRWDPENRPDAEYVNLCLREMYERYFKEPKVTSDDNQVEFKPDRLWAVPIPKDDLRYDVPHPVSNFYGREDELKQLGWLFEFSDRPFVILENDSGCDSRTGKTQLALKFLQRRRNYTHQGYFDFTLAEVPTKDNLFHNLCSFCKTQAHRFILLLDNIPEDKAESVFDLLTQLRSQLTPEDCFILLTASFPTTARFPSKSSLVDIMFSRDNPFRLKSEVDVRHLGPWTEIESVGFVKAALSSLGEQEDKDILELCTKLQRSPERLANAISHIHKAREGLEGSGYSIRSFLNNLVQDNLSQPEESPPDLLDISID